MNYIILYEQPDCLEGDKFNIETPNLIPPLRAHLHAGQELLDLQITRQASTTYMIHKTGAALNAA